MSYYKEKRVPDKILSGTVDFLIALWYNQYQQQQDSLML